MPNYDSINMLKEIFEKQKELAIRYGVPVTFDFSQPLSKGARTHLQHALEETANAIIHEAVELRDWLPWKHWSEQPGNKVSIELWSEEHLLELKREVVDILHFTIELALILGISDVEIYEQYCQKNKENHERQDTKVY